MTTCMRLTGESVIALFQPPAVHDGTRYGKCPPSLNVWFLLSRPPLCSLDVCLLAEDKMVPSPECVRPPRPLEHDEKSVLVALQQPFGELCGKKVQPSNTKKQWGSSSHCAHPFDIHHLGIQPFLHNQCLEFIRICGFLFVHPPPGKDRPQALNGIEIWGEKGLLCCPP